MRYLSLFSGVEAATLAWEPLGFEAVAFAEVEKFPSAVLAERFPSVPNLGDVTRITEDQIASLGPIDIVVFGSPCQDLSVAGKRAGLEGERSGLFRTAIDIIRWAREHCGCRFALWENVPGCFSTNKGRDFAAVVEAMAGLRDVGVPRYGWGKEGAAVGDHGMLEWSTLDAQWFGVAQRRRRVFALADFGDWPSRPPILLEPQGLRGDSPPSRQPGKGFAADVAPCLKASGAGVARVGETRGQDTVIVAFGQNRQSGPVDVSHAINAHGGPCGRLDFESETFVVHGTQDPCTSKHVAFALGRNNGGENVIAQGVTGDVAHTLNTANNGKGCSEDGTGRGVPTVALGDLTVRRLTPAECEILQGMPPGHSAITYRGRPAADGPRYKAIGNSFAVPVVRWIGKRIIEQHNKAKAKGEP